MRKHADLLLGFLGACLALGVSCDRRPRPPGSTLPGSSPPIAGPSHEEPVLPEAPERLCTGVVILLDTSSSMLQQVQDAKGVSRPKHQIVGEALERILERTAQWKAAHPDAALEIGILQFSSSVTQLIPMGPPELEKSRSVIKSVTIGSGTAIGRALEEAHKALARTGCLRKHIVCLTDGDNTSGPPPDRIARKYHAAAKGGVEIHFVAFDTSARKFDFLKQVNGSAVEATDGEELEKRILQIFEKRILVEEMPAAQ
jgi:hypothetical protein